MASHCIGRCRHHQQCVIEFPVTSGRILPNLPNKPIFIGRIVRTRNRTRTEQAPTRRTFGLFG